MANVQRGEKGSPVGSAEGPTGGSVDRQAVLRSLPAVSAVLEWPEVRALTEHHGLGAVTRAVRAALDVVRGELQSGVRSAAAFTAADVTARLLAKGSLRPAINATGIVVHTNLGRAPLAAEAIEAVVRVAQRYSTLEYDATLGRRGDRHGHATELLVELTGAEDAAVVNNNAGAVLLALAALARDRDAVVSRGELVEIGGGFRIPDVMLQSGARLVEVGTTNRTWLADYERVTTADTGALLKVHRSNFAIVGFVAEVGVAELAPLAHRHGVPLVVDAGSGAVFAHPSAPDEVPARALLAAGADLVLFSGDKLLGGPQAGILVGKRALLTRIRAHPLMRALRPDKLCLAALVATLRLWLEAPERVPVWRMAHAPLDEVVARCRRMAEALAARGVEAEVRPTEAAFGGGTTPSARRPSAAVALAGGAEALAHWAAGLRAWDPVIVGRMEGGALLLDLLTVHPQDDAAVLAAITAVVGPAGGEDG